jgi:glycosyltransferase involved in cell wall biosynthesis
MKIAVITCYFDPNYVRARSLRAALKTLPGVQSVVVKNTHKGVLRYPEILWKLWNVRRHEKPDVYLLTFRGQEILPFVLLLAGKKPVWFDELIVPIAYAKAENHKKSFAIRVKHSLARVSEPLYRSWLKRCRVILADTTAHAELSARTSNLNMRKLAVIPVGTDETVFKPSTAKPTATKQFQVFYYSSGMQPLHGIPVVLAAAELLKDQPDIEFLVVGGKQPLAKAVKAAAKNGANISYESWIPFADLIKTMRSSGVCLAGPFGNTQQAQNVVTTKAYQILASQCPAVLGDSVSTAEYFTDKQNALVVPQGDPEALAAAIRWAYAHPKELRTVAENGRKLYEKQFSTAAIARRLQALVDAS